MGVCTGQVMGGLKDWRVAAIGIVVQEGRFVQDEFEPRDKKEVKGIFCHPFGGGERRQKIDRSNIVLAPDFECVKNSTTD